MLAIVEASTKGKTLLAFNEGRYLRGLNNYQGGGLRSTMGVVLVILEACVLLQTGIRLLL